MSLPPLPKKIILHTQLPDHYWYGDVVGHTDAAMKAYGQACREAALEEAAKFIEGGSFLHDQSPAKLFADQLAPKIRGLK